MAAGAAACPADWVGRLEAEARRAGGDCVRVVTSGPFKNAVIRGATFRGIFGGASASTGEEEALDETERPLAVRAVARRPIAKGDEVCLLGCPEAHIAAIQTAASRNRFPACACCLRQLGGLDAQLRMLLEGCAEEAALDDQQWLPPLTKISADSAFEGVPCTCGQGCSVLYCSDRCKARGRSLKVSEGATGHALLCTAGENDSHPLVLFREHALRTAEPFLLAALVLARAALAVQRTAAEGVGSGGDAFLVDAERKIVLPTYRAPDGPFRKKWWELASHGAEEDAAELCSALEAQARHAFALLNEGIEKRCADVGCTNVEWIFTFDNFEGVLAVLDVAVTALDGDSDLARYSRDLLGESDESIRAAACAVLSPAVLDACEYRVRKDTTGDAESEVDDTFDDDSDYGSDEEPGEVDEEKDSDNSDSVDDSNDSDDSDDDDDDDGSGGDDVRTKSGEPGNARKRRRTDETTGPTAARQERADGGNGSGAGMQGELNGFLLPLAPPPSVRVQTERRLADIGQDPAGTFGRLDAVALFPLLGLFRHSCMPNCQTEVLPSPAHDAGGPALRVIAVRDIGEGETLSLSAIKSTGRIVTDRRAELRERLDIVKCMCERCTWEDILAGGGGRNIPERCVNYFRVGNRLPEGVDPRMHAVSLLERVALSFQEEGAYADSRRVIDTAFDLLGADAMGNQRNGTAQKDGEPRVLEESEHAIAARLSHTLGVALLGMGRWPQAQEQWERALATFGTLSPHTVAQGAKDAAYTWWKTRDIQASKASSWATWGTVNEFHPSKAFVTGSPGEPALSGTQCDAIILACEAHAAANGGWTTSRHYSAPTTDLPVQAVPEVLGMFNALLFSRIAPLLADQFPLQVKRADCLRVHDAFVVKYDATGGGAQRSLPVHQDEGQISLTIALNADSEYEGGGTRFRFSSGAGEEPAKKIAETEVVVMPSKGHVVSFLSNCRHAGEPITSGKRYIIAAFLYSV